MEASLHFESGGRTMNAHAIASMLAVATLVLSSGPPAAAGHADILRHYRFLTRHSTLTPDRPWLEAPSIPYPVYGTFDVVFIANHDDPWTGQDARFLNVDAYASHPFTDMAPISLNDALNLEGLVGRQLPVAAPFDVYQFTGQTEDGSSVSLFADVIGPWFRLHGGTTPATGGENHVVYDLASLARELPFADFNGDNLVDASDLPAWTGNYGRTITGADTGPFGDAGGDRLVDGGDFLAWQSQVGLATPSMSAAAPEPATRWLACVAIVLVCAATRFVKAMAPAGAAGARRLN
jgi:hypothetical protein